MIFASLIIGFVGSIHIGIDLGSELTKSSFSKYSEIPEIGYNYESKRMTPTFVGFRVPRQFDMSKIKNITDEEASLFVPSFGEKAVSVLQNKHGIGAGYLPLFIDMNDAEKTKQDKIFLLDSSLQMDFPDLLTTYLKMYIECIANGNNVDSITLTVPAYYTLTQRRMLSMAVRNAGYKYLDAIDDIDAVINTYSLEKTNKFVNKPLTVLFVDIGATTIKSYVVQFEINQNNPDNKNKAFARKLSYEFKRENGGAYLTLKIKDLIKEKLNLENLSIIDERKIFDAAERLKKRLTVLKTTSVFIEEINGEDRSVTVTRDELNNLAQSLIQDLIDVTKKAINCFKIDEFELLGGCSRVPILIDSLKEFLNVSFLGHSLSDEALASGAVYYSQFRQAISRYKPIQTQTNISIYNIYGKYDNHVYTLCQVNGNCIDELKIDGKENSTFTIYYDNNTYLNTLNSKSYSYIIDNNKNNSLIFKFSKAPFDILYAKTCENITSCKYTSFIPFKLPEFIPSSRYHVIIDSENKRKKMGELRSKLEQFAHQIIEEVKTNQTVQDFTNENQRATILNVAENVEKWIYENNNEQNLTNKFAELRNVIIPVYNRINTNRTLITSISYLVKSLQICRYAAFSEIPANRTYINQTDVIKFSTKINETERRLFSIVKQIEHTPLWEDINISSNEIILMEESLRKEYIKIMSIKPPSGHIQYISKFKDKLNSFKAKITKKLNSLKEKFK